MSRASASVGLIVGRDARKRRSGLWPGRLAPAAEIVEAQDPIAARIERPSRTYDLAPAAALGILGIEQETVAPDAPERADDGSVLGARVAPGDAHRRQPPAVVQRPVTR